VRYVLIALALALALVAPADAFQTITERIGVEYSISTSTTTSYNGAFIDKARCDGLFYGVFGKYTNAAAVATIYADTASSVTTTRYQRSAALGTVGGRSTWYMREATAAENMPASRFTLSFPNGFTGTVGTYCTHPRD
jgi:hypothetical protein